MWKAAVSCCAALLISSSSSQAIYLRVFDAVAHQRFHDLTTSPRVNSGHIFFALDLTGIGFRSNRFPPTQCALVTRQHVIFATHNRDKLVGVEVTFINAENQAVTRSCGAQTIIYKDGVPSDLVLVRLNAPIDADSGITPLPYYDLNLRRSTELGVTGRDDMAWENVDKVPLLGRGAVDKTSEEFGIGVYVNGQEIETTMYRFDYTAYVKATYDGYDDCILGSSDSGNPTFVPVGNVAALLGVHSYRDAQTVSPDVRNYDTLVPHYVAELDAALQPLGYRMRPLSTPATTLAGSGGFVQEVPRKAMPLDYDYTLQNTGAETAGSAELQLDFAAGCGPTSITASDWVVYGSGERWTLRRSTLDSGAASTIRVSWSEAPSVENLCLTVSYRAENSSELCSEADLGLCDSLADWAGELAEAGLSADPDGDRIENLIEYGLGGDPAAPGCQFADGGPLLPVAAADAASVSYSHPERSDKLERGLGYQLEFSNDLLQWNATLPPGFTSTTEAYDPAVPGFVRRCYRWNRNGADRFVRLQITLSE